MVVEDVGTTGAAGVGGFDAPTVVFRRMTSPTAETSFWVSVNSVPVGVETLKTISLSPISKAMSFRFPRIIPSASMTLFPA